MPPDCRVRLGFMTEADSGAGLGHDASSWPVGGVNGHNACCCTFAVDAGDYLTS